MRKSVSRVLQQAEIIGIKCNGCLLHGGVEFVFGQVASPDDDDLPAGLNQSVSGWSPCCVYATCSGALRGCQDIGHR